MNALDIMEYAVNQGGKEYQFSATYYKDLGFFISKLNDIEGNSICGWNIYIGHPDGTEDKASVGVSSLNIQASNALILTFEENSY